MVSWLILIAVVFVINKSYEHLHNKEVNIKIPKFIKANHTNIEECALIPKFSALAPAPAPAPALALAPTRTWTPIPKPVPIPTQDVAIPSPTQDTIPFASASVVSSSNEDHPPLRFLRATKGDIAAAEQRWRETLNWRDDFGMDKILNELHPNLALIKENYPHYFHGRGRNNEPCYYEKPAKINLKVLRLEGIQLDDLLRHYALCCEYMWRKIEPSEEGRSIYIIDLDGIKLRDFVGDVVDFVRKASAFTGAHYPERSGSIFVINVPGWFNIIWNAVRLMVDEVTKEKITILGVGNKSAITNALLEKITIDNIPKEYGGTSMDLGLSPEEEGFTNYFASLGELATAGRE